MIFEIENFFLFLSFSSFFDKMFSKRTDKPRKKPSKILPQKQTLQIVSILVFQPIVTQQKQHPISCDIIHGCIKMLSLHRYISVPGHPVFSMSRAQLESKIIVNRCQCEKRKKKANDKSYTVNKPYKFFVLFTCDSNMWLLCIFINLAKLYFHSYCTCTYVQSALLFS